MPEVFIFNFDIAEIIMSISITASNAIKTSVSLSDTQSNTISTLTDSKNNYVSFTYGSGYNQISNAGSITGVLPSSGSYQIDFQSITQPIFGSNQNINFSGIKQLSIYNESTQYGYDLSITATGSNACTNVFNGESGNFILKPYSVFNYTDVHYGFEISASQRYLQLNDQGSGVTYKIIVMGVEPDFYVTPPSMAEEEAPPPPP